MKHLINRTTQGVIWSGIERFSVQIIQFAISLILARLLSPSDFGILAIILVIMNILQTVNEVGFGAALIHKLDRDELDFSTIFAFNVVFGFVLYVLLYMLAPFIAEFFEQLELAKLTRILGLNLIINSFVVVQRVRLIINIDFKTQAKASLIAVLISGGLGIYCAYIGLGIMALLIQSLLNSAISTFLICIFAKWCPKLQFSCDRFFVLFRYAYKLILARVINSVFQEIYSLVIGKLYTPSQLGYFNRAKTFEQLSSNNITNIVQRVSTPLLCEAQKDSNNMSNILLRFIQNTALIVYPILFGMFVLAEPIIRVLLTDKWLPTAWILKVLCPIGLFYVISTFNITVFNATGRTDWALKSEVIKKGIFILVFAVAIYIGFEALVYSQIVIATIEFSIDTFYTKKLIGLTVFKQIKSVSGIFISALVMAIVVWMTISMLNSYLLKLVVGMLIGIIVYFTICYFFNVANFKSIIYSITKRIK